jgi:hypothetical protein
VKVGTLQLGGGTTAELALRVGVHRERCDPGNQTSVPAERTQQRHCEHGLAARRVYGTVRCVCTHLGVQGCEAGR